MSTKKVLVDTDIGPDCDDVAALANDEYLCKSGDVRDSRNWTLHV